MYFERFRPIYKTSFCPIGLFAKIIFLEVVASFDYCIMNFYYPLFQTKLKEIQNNFTNDFFTLHFHVISLIFLEFKDKTHRDIFAIDLSSVTVMQTA